MIKNYSDLIMRRFSNSFDSELKEYFGFISDGATRMHQLINALLQYSRISSAKKEFESVDCNEIVNEVLKDLKIIIDDSKALITSTNLPIVSGNKAMLRLLFQNLIQNAVKFKDENIPEVDISAERKENNWLIRIKDNGIGIAPEYHDKIFLIFQRLHTRDKFPGTGIGLAACKKIVEHHGGKICLDSVVGQGTIFYFTLPIK
jgi:light-regulated signal transduction histidine kinase (bacteriophytochrome)